MRFGTLAILAGCGLASLTLGSVVRAQAPAESDALSEIVVKGQLLPSEATAYSATLLTTEQIRLQAPSNVDELFRAVPGMAVRDLQLGTVANAIVIRGFGNGGHGGDLGAVIDGVPLNEAMSHADGYVDLNVIIPLEIDSFTVFKGPVSALYGNYNRGGLVHVQTRKGGDYAAFDASVGAFDTLDVQSAYGRTFSTSELNVAGRLYLTDGYRPASDTRRGVFAARWSTALTPSLQAAISARLFRGDSDSASYLTAEQFASDPQGIDARVHDDGADKSLRTFRADLNYDIAEDLKLLTFAYATHQSFTRWFTRPVDATTWRQREETYDREVYGAGASFNGTATLGTVAARYIAGVETFREGTDYKFFDGSDRRRRMQPAQADRATELNSVSAFMELSADLHRLASASIGLRADRFTGGCRRLGLETGSDPCGALAPASHVSPKIGLKSAVTDWLTLRTSWAEGFALANGFVKYAVGGQPLDETVFRQTEIGAHVALAASLDFDIAAYRLRSRGEVRTVSPGVYENYGATRREGIEASLRWSPSELFELAAVYGLTQTRIEQNADARLLGLAVPGVPKHTATLEAALRPVAGLAIDATWRYVGAYQVDALNTQQASSYGLLDLGIAYVRAGEHRYRLYARLENALDRRYATSVSLIGGERLFAPGAPRVLRTGVQIDL